MRLLKGDVGRRCLVEWDDVGRAESMILEVDDGGREAKVYNFSSRAVDSVDSTQVVERNEYVTPNGLLISQHK